MEVQPNIKGRIHLDEKVVHIGARHCYDLNAIDSKTNYVLAHLFVEKRTLLACTTFYEQIKRTCYTHKPSRKENTSFTKMTVSNWSKTY